MTSVKEFRIDTEATEASLGRGRFYFTDDYSVFDWGQMPDTVPDKGKSLCTMGAHTFERLEAQNIPTHYRGVVTETASEPVPLSEVAVAPREMAIDLARVPDLPNDGRDYDYDAYHADAGAFYLIPLEVVFRNTVPPGSSLRRRSTPAEHGLDLETWPEEPVELDTPIVEFSTKYEAGDRYLDEAEAAEIAGRAGLDALGELARDVNHQITEEAAHAGFEHQDGKIECIWADGEIRVADVAGTLDENRFCYEQTQVSKELIRQFYRREQPEWIEAIQAGKAEANAQDDPDWHAYTDVTPDALPSHVRQAAADLYAASANAYSGHALLNGPSIEEAVDTVRTL